MPRAQTGRWRKCPMAIGERGRTEVMKRASLGLNYTQLLLPAPHWYLTKFLFSLFVCPEPQQSSHLLCGEETNPTVLLGPAPCCSSAPQIPKYSCQSTENIPNLFSWLSSVCTPPNQRCLPKLFHSLSQKIPISVALQAFPSH